MVCLLPLPLFEFHMSQPEEDTVINPIAEEYFPRLTKEFVELYNKTGALRLAGHQVPLEEVPVGH